MNQRNQPTQPAFWFNLRTKSVEFGLLSPAIYRVGPFETEAEAERAIELLKERAEKWRDEDEEQR